MADFTSGVARYIMAQATVTVGFPVDHKGNAEICCYQCGYYRRNYRTCGLNNEICAFPEKYVGDHCPLRPVEEDTNEKD